MWVELDKEIGQEMASLEALLERTAAYVQSASPHSDSNTPVPAPGSPPAPRTRRWRLFWRSFWFRLWPPKTPPVALAGQHPAPATPRAPQATVAGAGTGLTPYRLAGLEAERRQARTKYLAAAATLDSKIQEYNTHRPRALTWLEKPRLLPHLAAARFDSRCPPLV